MQQLLPPEVLVSTADRRLSRLIEDGTLSIPDAQSPLLPRLQPQQAVLAQRQLLQNQIKRVDLKLKDLRILSHEPRRSLDLLGPPPDHPDFVHRMVALRTQRLRVRQSMRDEANRKQIEGRLKAAQLEEDERCSRRRERHDQVVKRLSLQQLSRKNRQAELHQNAIVQAQLKIKKPLFKKIELEYKRHCKQKLREEARILQQLKEKKRSVPLDQLDEHRQRLEQLAQERSRSTKSTEKYQASHYKSESYAKCVEERKALQVELQAAKNQEQQRFEKMREFLQRLKSSFKPKENQGKRKQLQHLLLKAVTRPRQKSDPREAGLQNLKEAKAKAKVEAGTAKLKQRVQETNPKPAVKDYLAQLKSSGRREKGPVDSLKLRLVLEGPLTDQKRRLFLQQTSVLDEQARRKLELARVRREQADQVAELMLQSVNAKLAVLAH